MVARKRVVEEVRAAERAAAKAARQAKAPPPEAGETMASLAEKLRQREQQLKGAQTRIRNLARQKNALAERKTILMSPTLLRALRAAFHPDRAPTDPKERARLEALSKELNSFKFVAHE
jgi:hypothetical protein